MTESKPSRYFISPGILWRWNGKSVNILREDDPDRDNWVESTPAMDLERLIAAYEANQIHEIVSIPEAK